MGTISKLMGTGVPAQTAAAISDGTYTNASTTGGTTNIYGGSTAANGAAIYVNGSTAGGSITFEPTSAGNVTAQFLTGYTGKFRIRNSTSGNINLAVSETGNLEVLGTVAGATGNVTINQPSGIVKFAAAATTLTLTNSLITANSKVFLSLVSNDSTAKSCVCVPASGSAVLTLNAAATAQTNVAFLVIN